jgi:hypothetical protein
VKKRNILLILGTGLAIAGVIVDIIPVPTTLGYGCGNLGCVTYKTFTVPSIVLGAVMIVFGLVILAYCLAMDEEVD